MRAAPTILAVCVAMVCRAQQPFDLDSSYRTSISERYVNSLVALPDGKLVISGLMTFPEFPWSQIRLARLTPDGALDQSFEATGIGGGKITAWNDKYYVRGGQTVRRVELDGTNDLSFGISAGTVPYFSPGQGGDYHVYPDGRVLMTGLHVLSDSIRGFEGFYSLVWFTNTGYLDTTLTHRTSDNAISSIHQQPDGKFLLSGWVSTYEGQPVGRIFRVHPDGALDTTFQTDFDWGYAQSISVLPDERVIASGYMTEPGLSDTLKIVRLLADGSMDPTFNNMLSVTHDAFGSYLELRHHLLPDGRIVLLGQFDHVDGDPRGGLALLDPDGGLLNDAFTGTGCGQVINTNLNTHVQGAVSMTPAPDGSYYVSGIWRGYDDGTVNDTTQRYVSRLFGLDVGVREVEEPVQLEVYPNPAHTSTTVRWARPGSYQLRLLDVTGREVHRSAHHGTEAVLDLTGLPAGPYLIHLTDRTHRRWSRTLIVEP